MVSFDLLAERLGQPGSIRAWAWLVGSIDLEPFPLRWLYRMCQVPIFYPPAAFLRCDIHKFYQSRQGASLERSVTSRVTKGKYWHQGLSTTSPPGYLPPRWTLNLDWGSIEGHPRLLHSRIQAAGDGSPKVQFITTLKFNVQRLS